MSHVRAELAVQFEEALGVARGFTEALVQLAVKDDGHPTIVRARLGARFRIPDRKAIRSEHTAVEDLHPPVIRAAVDEAVENTIYR